MKNRTILFGILFLFVFLFSTNNVQAKDNSKYFEDVVFQEGGDFLGISFGMTKDSVQMILPAEALDDESGDYLYYYWELGNHQYYLDLAFNSEDKLSSIDGYVYCYTKDGKDDDDEAENLYDDMLDYFTDTYGKEEEYRDDGFTYTYWYMDDLDAEVGLDDNEIYWYLYDYSYDEYGYYEDVEPTPLYLADLDITKDAFYGLKLGEARSKVKSMVDEEYYYDSGLNDLMYNFEEGTNAISLNFVFNKEDKISVIDGYVDFPYSYYYDWELEGEDAEEDARENFYQELRTLFNDTYGERKEKAISDYRRICTWRFEGKELILMTDDYSVSWIYSYDE